MTTTVAPVAEPLSHATATTRPLVLIHGYDSEAKAFEKWKQIFATHLRLTPIHVGNYVSLSNEVTIKDIAEGLDRALALNGFGPETEFDAVVHSTGMLVIRSWLATYPERRGRLKHLIGLAPASFGSPLAHKGRSWLGSIFKGSKHLGADFLEAGDEVLDALELGSRFTWDLAHQDLFVDKPMFGPDGTTPWVFIFCGNTPYHGIAKLVGEPGTDGTVRWAGVSLNSRKITIDLSRRAEAKARVELGALKAASPIPLVFVADTNHGTIMSDPPQRLQELVLLALRVNSAETLAEWSASAEETSAAARPKPYQQFVVRVVDERGDPVTDYNTRVLAGRTGGQLEHLHEFDDDVHAYGRDKSFRNFHVDVSSFLKTDNWDRFELHLTASSGSKLVGYRGFSLADTGTDSVAPVEEIRVSLLPVLRRPDFKFFFPHTTTLIEIILNREPLPVNEVNKVYQFVADHS